MNARNLPLLVAPALRAMPWGPILAATGLGLAIVAVPAALSVALAPNDLVGLLRAAAICGALGVGFVLDDPSAATVETVPTPRPVRWAARAVAILPALAAWWSLLLVITIAGAEEGTGAAVPLAAVTLEAATLSAVSLAAAAARRRTTFDSGGVVASPTVFLLAVAAILLPPNLALYVRPDDPAWAEAHRRWAALLALAAVAAAWASRQPTRRRPHHQPPNTPSSA